MDNTSTENNVNKYNEYEPKTEEKTEENSVITIGNWIGTMILTMIPIVNIIMLLIWAFSKKIPKSKKNWAIASCIVILIGIVIYFILFIPIFFYMFP